MKKTVALLILLLLVIGCQNVQANATDATDATDAAPTPTTAMAEAPAAEPTSAPAEAPYALSFTAQTLDGETVTDFPVTPKVPSRGRHAFPRAVKNLRCCSGVSA